MELVGSHRTEVATWWTRKIWQSNQLTTHFYSLQVTKFELGMLLFLLSQINSSKVVLVGHPNSIIFGQFYAPELYFNSSLFATFLKETLFGMCGALDHSRPQKALLGSWEISMAFIILLFLVPTNINFSEKGNSYFNSIGLTTIKK